jgi:hypothetical protein
MIEDELASNDEFGVPVHVIPKGPREQIRISLNEYRGFDYIDIRSFYLSDHGYRPSKKGVTLKKDLYPELFRGIMQLGETLGFDDETLASALDE